MTHDPIPGITVTLTENPLHSKVTMTESARREYVLRFALKQMEDMAWEIKFRSDDQSTAYNPKRATDAVSAFTEFEGHDVYPENSFEFWEAYGIKHHLDHYLHALNEEHGGDCTAVACSCTRCWAESLAGIDTLPGGKQLNASIAAKFASPPTDPKSIAFRESQKKKSEEYWETVRQENPERWNSMLESRENNRRATEAFMAEHKRRLDEQNAAEVKSVD